MYSHKKITEEKVNLNFSQNTKTFKSLCMYQRVPFTKRCSTTRQVCLSAGLFVLLISTQGWYCKITSKI